MQINDFHQIWGFSGHCLFKYFFSLSLRVPLGICWYILCCPISFKVNEGESFFTLWLTVCDPRDYTVHGILQARTLEWVAILFSRGSSQPRDRTQVSHVAGGFFTSWTTRKAPQVSKFCLFFSFFHSVPQTGKFQIYIFPLIFYFLFAQCLKIRQRWEFRVFWGLSWARAQF